LQYRFLKLSAESDGVDDDYGHALHSQHTSIAHIARGEDDDTSVHLSCCFAASLLAYLMLLSRLMMLLLLLLRLLIRGQAHQLLLVNAVSH